VVPEFDNPGHTHAVGIDPYFREVVRCFYKYDTYTMPGYPVPGY
jgi:hypothetical protein